MLPNNNNTKPLDDVNNTHDNQRVVSSCKKIDKIPEMRNAQRQKRFHPYKRK